MQCRVPLSGDAARALCAVACDACGRCVQDAPEGGESAVLDHEIAYILLRDEKTEQLVVRAAAGAWRAIDSPMSVPAGRGISSWVLEHREAQNIEDVRSDPRYVGDPEVRSELIVPLVSGGRAIGVLVLSHRKVAAFSQRELMLMQTVGAQIAAAIDVAELHDAFNILEIGESEHVGFFKKGEGGKAVVSGKTSLGGQIPINMSGGLKARGHPVGATGVAQIVDIVFQLRHELGKERQVKNAKNGFTINFGGFGNNVLAFVLRRVEQ